MTYMRHTNMYVIFKYKSKGHTGHTVHPFTHHSGLYITAIENLNTFIQCFKISTNEMSEINFNMFKVINQ